MFSEIFDVFEDYPPLCEKATRNALGLLFMFLPRKT